MQRKTRRRADDAAFDLTPMIDCVFQLLIFFLVCTSFGQHERDLVNHMPTDTGQMGDIAPPREQLTIYCQWDEAESANHYVIAIGARHRRVVAGSRAKLADLVIYPSDPIAVIRQKRAAYKRAHDALASEIAMYLPSAGADIEKFEISFARDARLGARSGTAPWTFVSLAIDACVGVNKSRKSTGQAELPVAFKFSNAGSN